MAKTWEFDPNTGKFGWVEDYKSPAEQIADNQRRMRLNAYAANPVTMTPDQKKKITPEEKKSGR